MSRLDTRIAPLAIAPREQWAWRKKLVKSWAGLDLLPSVALALLLIPTFLYLGISIAIVLPLSTLVGLTSRHLFRLILNLDKSDVFYPTTLVVVYFAIDFAARSFCLSTIPFFPRTGRNPYDDYLPAALWCACIAYVAFSAGIGSGIAKRWVKRSHAAVYKGWPRTFPALKLLILLLLGLGSLAYLFKLGMAVGNFASLEFRRNPPPGIAVLLENLLDLTWIAVCIFLLAPVRKSNRGLILLAVAVSAGALAAKLAISGGKVALIQPLLEAAIVFHYGKRRFRIWEMVIFGVPVVMLAFGVVNFYRFVVVGHQGAPKTITDVMSRISSTSDLLKLNNTDDQTPALEQLVMRDAGTDALALIMKYTPRPYPYALGIHWLEIPLTFVPRQIWKDKPVNMPSAEFESTYMGMPSTFNGYSSVHLVGDLYRNFSYPGVIGGMFFLGVLLRFFYLFCSPSRENPTGLFLYAALLPEVTHSLESDVGYALINVMRAALLAIAVAVFLGVRFGSRRRRLRARPFVMQSQPFVHATVSAPIQH